MMQLQLYELNYLDALYYVKENLINTNTLSSMLATRLDFKSGRFFTLLPQGIDIKKIYNFDHAGIAKGIRDKIADVIKHKLFLYSDISCIFDDASATFTPGYTDHLFSVLIRKRLLLSL